MIGRSFGEIPSGFCRSVRKSNGYFEHRILDWLPNKGSIKKRGDVVVFWGAHEDIGGLAVISKSTGMFPLLSHQTQALMVELCMCYGTIRG